MLCWHKRVLESRTTFSPFAHFELDLPFDRETIFVQDEIKNIAFGHHNRKIYAILH